MANVLHTERNKDRKALCGQSTERLNLADTEGHRRIQPIKLLKLENTELAKVLSCCGKQSFCVIVKLLLGVRRVNHRQNGKHHSLVTGRQVVKELFHFLALLFNVVGKLGRKVVVGILPTLPVGRIGFNAEQAAFSFPHGFVRGHGDNINGHHQIAVEVGHFRYHTVLDIGGILSQEQHSAVTLTDLEIIARELHRVRADEILEVVSLSAGFLDVEAELRFFTGTVKVVENAEPFMVVQGLGPAVQLAEALSQVNVHPLEEGAGLLDVLPLNGNGDVFILNEVVALHGLLHEDAVVLLPVLVQAVPFQPHEDAVLEVGAVETAVVDGDFRRGPGRQAVEDAAVGQKHFLLILMGRYGVVNVREAPRPAVFSVHHPYPVPIDALDGYGLLDAAGDFEMLSLALVGGG